MWVSCNFKGQEALLRNYEPESRKQLNGYDITAPGGIGHPHMMSGIGANSKFKILNCSDSIRLNLRQGGMSSGEKV